MFNIIGRGEIQDTLKRRDELGRMLRFTSPFRKSDALWWSDFKPTLNEKFTLNGAKGTRTELMAIDRLEEHFGSNAIACLNTEKDIFYQSCGIDLLFAVKENRGRPVKYSIDVKTSSNLTGIYLFAKKNKELPGGLMIERKLLNSRGADNNHILVVDIRTGRFVLVNRLTLHNQLKYNYKNINSKIKEEFGSILIPEKHFEILEITSLLQNYELKKGNPKKEKENK